MEILTLLHLDNESFGEYYKDFYYNFFFNNYAKAAVKNEIIVNVGNQIITSYELKNKIRTYLFLGGIELNQENVNKRELNKIKLKTKDKIEIVHFIGGG